LGRSLSLPLAGTRFAVGTRLPRAARGSGRAGRASSGRLQLLFSTLVAVLLVLLAPSLVRAETADQVKAAFLFNFARYVEWPPSAFASDKQPIRLCVLGQAELEGVVSRIVSGRSVRGRPVEVAGVADLAATAGCHLLFLGAGAGVSGSVVAQSLGAEAIFTISDEPGFAAGGGIANFILVDQKIRFEINPGSAKRAGLRISSSLLRLAKLVGESGR
jgi:YfiR/HmsC-like